MAWSCAFGSTSRTVDGDSEQRRGLEYEEIEVIRREGTSIRRLHHPQYGLESISAIGGWFGIRVGQKFPSPKRFDFGRSPDRHGDAIGVGGWTDAFPRGDELERVLGDRSVS